MSADTTDIINEYHKAHPLKGNKDIFYNAERVECADGFHMSGQASDLHYCRPRAPLAWPYTHFEIGFPSHEVAAILEYADEPSDPAETVYSCVPVETIVAIVEAHGGIKP